MGNGKEGQGRAGAELDDILTAIRFESMRIDSNRFRIDFEIGKVQNLDEKNPPYPTPASRLFFVKKGIPRRLQSKLHFISHYYFISLPAYAFVISIPFCRRKSIFGVNPFEYTTPGLGLFVSCSSSSSV